MNIICNDGITVQLPNNQIACNTTLSDLLEDVFENSQGTPIPFPSTSMENLKALTSIQQTHCENVDSINDTYWRDNLHPQEEAFLISLEDQQCPRERKWDAIGNLAILADFLDNQQVFHACIKYIAKVLDCQNVETLRKILQVENDLTPKEEDTIRNYNKWCEQQE